MDITEPAFKKDKEFLDIFGKLNVMVAQKNGSARQLTNT